MGRSATDRTATRFRPDLVPLWAKVAAACAPSITWRRASAIDSASTHDVWGAAVDRDRALMALPHVTAALWADMGLDGPPGSRPIPLGCERPGGAAALWYTPMALLLPLAVACHYLRRRIEEGQ